MLWHVLMKSEWHALMKSEWHLAGTPSMCTVLPFVNAVPELRKQGIDNG